MWLATLIFRLALGRPNQRGVGRSRGVGRGLGVTLGVAVGVAVGVTLGVGEGVGVGATGNMAYDQSRHREHLCRQLRRPR